MSADNVRLVGSLQPPPGRDLTAIFRDESTVNVLTEAMAPMLDPALQSRFLSAGEQGTVNTGVKGLRKTWLEWLEGWDSYRTDKQRLIDAGDKVLAMSVDYARKKDEEEEERLSGAAVWTVAGGRIAAVDLYEDLAQALKDVGMEPKPKG